MKRLLFLWLPLLISLSLIPLSVQAQETPPSPLADQGWVRLGGPLGGLGYDIRMNPDNPDLMYVTDAFSGVHISQDGGLTWEPSNEGIDVQFGSVVQVFCLTIDPNDDNIVWAGLQNMGMLFRSADGGQSWEGRSNGITDGQGLSFRGITVEPGNSEVVYAAGEIASWNWNGSLAWGREFDRTQGVLYKSTDGGQTWSAIWRGDNLARYLWIDPRDVNVLYLSTGIFDREAANSDPVAGTPGGLGILKSTDGGASWTEINEGLGNLYVGSLFMHPENPDILLAATGVNTYPEGAGVYLTEDGGASWQQVAQGWSFSSVEFALSDPNIAYAGGESDFLRSEDGGHTWQNLDWAPGMWGPEDIRPGFPIDFQVDPRDADRIFVNNYGGGNLLSEDGGQSWVSASTGYTGVEMISVSVDPSNPATVYGAARSGPFMSQDGGITWLGLNPRDVNEIAETAHIFVNPADPQRLLMSSQEGVIFESSTMPPDWRISVNFNEQLWDREVIDVNSNFQGLQAVAFAPSQPERAYGGWGIRFCVIANNVEQCSNETIFDIFVSDDGGASWTEQEGTALQGLNITSIVVHPENPDTAWAATAGAGVFRTDDGGLTWTPSASNFAPRNLVMDLDIDPLNPDLLFAAVYGGAIYRSSDGGLTWTQSAAGLDPNDLIQTVAVDPVRPNVIYAGSLSQGVFLSEDSGGTWRALDTDLHTKNIRDLAISADGETLYAATIGEGVYRLSSLSQADFDALAPQPTPTPEPEPTQTPAPTDAPEVAEAQEPAATEAPAPSGRSSCPSSFAPLAFIPLAFVLRRRRA